MSEDKGAFELGDKLKLSRDSFMTLETETKTAIANAAYAEGRKAMEKDFKELLELANQLNSGYKSDYSGLNDMPVVSHKFDAWKKARGIE